MMYLALWMGGVLLGSGTLTFAFWQLGWMTPVAGIDLELVTCWFAFSAAVALNRRQNELAVYLIGLSLIPLVAAVLFLAFFDEVMLKSFAVNILGGGALFLLIVLIVPSAMAMDRLSPLSPRFQTRVGDTAIPTA